MPPYRPVSWTVALCGFHLFPASPPGFARHFLELSSAAMAVLACLPIEPDK
ncbi:MAG: hypothetical protein IID31_09440 [Planctomycetes bacterium]|nr:hypothetical protein [Planctomycetota bacterium]